MNAEVTKCLKEAKDTLSEALSLLDLIGRGDRTAEKKLQAMCRFVSYEGDVLCVNLDHLFAELDAYRHDLEEEDTAILVDERKPADNPDSYPVPQDTCPKCTSGSYHANVTTDQYLVTCQGCGYRWFEPIETPLT